MSKFHFKLDENGNVSDISFPKTNIEVKIEYPKSIEEGEVVAPSGISIDGQSMTINQFSEIKMEKDENGRLNISGGSSGGSDGDHPWWWDWWNKLHGTGNIKPVTDIDADNGKIESDPKNKEDMTRSTVIDGEEDISKTEINKHMDSQLDIYDQTIIDKGVTTK